MDLQEYELSQRLQIIEKYYDVDALLEGKIDNEVVEKYYRYTEFFYNFQTFSIIFSNYNLFSSIISRNLWATVTILSKGLRVLEV